MISKISVSQAALSGVDKRGARTDAAGQLAVEVAEMEHAAARVNMRNTGTPRDACAVRINF